MRKVISAFLCLLLVLSLAAVGISAAEGTAVKTAEEFAAMDASGKYYLDADITLTASYGEFKGTFDGNGHKITLDKVPAFAKLTGATVTNLTLEGSAEGDDDLGALANHASKVTITNVVNNASVTCASTVKSNAWIGGIVGSLDQGGGTKTEAEVSTITNCVNNGDVLGQHTDSNNAARLGGMVGNSAKYQKYIITGCVNNGSISYTGENTNTYIAGIIGGGFGGEIVNCVNNGKITATKASSAGGMLGRGSPSSQGGDQSQKVVGCVNNGEIESNGTAVGGMIAYVNEVKDTAKQTVTVDRCTNTAALKNSGSYVGGMIGYVWGSGSTSYATVTNCINTGALTGTAEGTWVSQVIAYTNSSATVITNNIGAGSVTAAVEDKNSFVGMSNADITQYKIENNFLSQAPKHLSYATDEANAANRVAFDDTLAAKVKVVDAAALASGEVCYLANQYAGTDVFLQTLGTDTAPTLDVTHKVVKLEGTTYVNTNDAPPAPPVTGDGTVWIAALAVLALFGAAFAVRKAREQ